MITLEAVLAVSEDPAGLQYARQADVAVLVLPPAPYAGPKPVFDPEPLLRTVAPESFHAIVVDMLDTPSGTLESLRRSGAAVITLDDRGEGRFSADGIINFLVREPTPDRLAAHTKLYEGPQFATLDPSFALPVVRRRRRTVGGARVLVTLGGADSAGLTVKVAEALRYVTGIASIDFVCGRAYGHERELRSALTSAPWRSRIVRAAPSLRPFFLGCDLAIVAGGMTIHEACCTGTPSVAVCQPIDHQLELAQWFAEQGAMTTIGDGTRVDEHTLREAVENLLTNAECRELMASVGPRLVDGHGTRRTAEAILEVSYTKHGR